MRLATISRRRFAGLLGAGFGSLLVRPRLAGAGLDQGPPPAATRGPIVLNSNENPYGPPPPALEAMTRAQSLGARYPDEKEDAVRAALAELHGVKPGQVILGCGSGEILRMADLAFLAEGRTLVTAEPTFEAVLDYAGVTRAEPIKVPLTADFRHDLPRMASACDQRTGLVYVCNPNNPTGSIVGGDELASFLARVPASATVLVDEAYHHFVEDPRYRSAFELLAHTPNLLVVRTFSKIYGLAGMRLGYAVGSEALIAALRPHAFWSNANAAVLEAALACLKDPELVSRQRRVMNDTRRWLCAALERDKRRYIPSQTNFVMIDVGRDVAELIDGFRERGVLVGRRFPSLPNWLRISIGTPEEMAAFVDGLRALAPARASAA